jgi:hypothetical protein
VDKVIDLGPEKMLRYRDLLASVAVPDDRKDDVIRVVGSLMQSFVDRAWGTDPVQILEQKRLKDLFKNAGKDAALCANLPLDVLSSASTARVDLGLDDRREGASTPNQKRRGWRHGKNGHHESGNLLPRI